MDCENCRYLMVVGLHDTGPRVKKDYQKRFMFCGLDCLPKLSVLVTGEATLPVSMNAGRERLEMTAVMTRDEECMSTQPAKSIAEMMRWRGLRCL